MLLAVLPESWPPMALQLQMDAFLSTRALGPEDREALPVVNVWRLKDVT